MAKSIPEIMEAAAKHNASEAGRRARHSYDVGIAVGNERAIVTVEASTRASAAAIIRKLGAEPRDVNMIG